MKSIFFFTIGWLISLTVSAQLLMREEPTTLKTSVGNIDGTLKVPDNIAPIPIAIIIAGSGPTDRDGNQPSMKSNAYKMLSDALFYNNIATLCYDKRGIAKSKVEQKEEDLRFDTYVDDVKAWIDQLSEDKRFSDIILIGHSEGSLLGMIAAQNNPKVAKYISIAGAGMPAPDILKEQLGKQLQGQPEAIKNMVFSYIDKLEHGETIPDVPGYLNDLFRPSVQPYMISWFKYNPQTEISKLTIPALLLQGTTDIQVGVDQAELLAKANPNAEKVIIENMDHVLKISETKDMTEQIKNSYNNPDTPISKELVKIITGFIKEK
ncbi:alpha/beta hydrolase [Bacteroidia bacterium]|nr:alpha/beta hydrolase [Bacteroidia bacterium]